MIRILSLIKNLQQLHINNAEYAVLEASEDFMKTALILVSGIVTDRIGGASSSPLLKT